MGGGLIQYVCNPPGFIFQVLIMLGHASKDGTLSTDAWSLDGSPGCFAGSEGT